MDEGRQSQSRVGLKYLNSEEVSKMLGVNVSTVKRWTDQGKLTCYRTAGGHRKFLMSDMVDFLRRNKQQNPRIESFPSESEDDVEVSYAILKEDFDALVRYLLKHARNCQRRRVQHVLNGLYLGKHPLHQIYDRVLTPVLHEIGALWEKGEISIVEEHLASQSIRDAVIRLQGIIRLPEKTRGAALILNLSNELHDIAVKMTDHILEEQGFRVMYSGQITVLDEIDRVFNRFKPDRVYVGSTYIEDKSQSNVELQELFEACRKYDAMAYLGGRGFDDLDTDHPSVAARVNTFTEVHQS